MPEMFEKALKLFGLVKYDLEIGERHAVGLEGVQWCVSTVCTKKDITIICCTISCGF